jgi:hypothetical protein
MLAAAALAVAGCKTVPVSQNLDSGLGAGDFRHLELAPSGRYLASVNPGDRSVTFFCLDHRGGDYDFETMRRWPPATVSFAGRGTPAGAVFGPGLGEGESVWVALNRESDVEIIRMYIAGPLSLGVPDSIHRLEGTVEDASVSRGAKTMALAMTTTDGTPALARLVTEDGYASPTVTLVPAEMLGEPDPAHAGQPRLRVGLSPDGAESVLVDLATARAYWHDWEAGSWEWAPFDWPSSPRPVVDWAALASIESAGAADEFWMPMGHLTPIGDGTASLHQLNTLVIRKASGTTAGGTWPMQFGWRGLESPDGRPSRLTGDSASGVVDGRAVVFVSWPQNGAVAVYDGPQGGAPAPLRGFVSAAEGRPGALALDERRGFLFVSLAERGLLQAIDLNAKGALPE